MVLLQLGNIHIGLAPIKFGVYFVSPSLMHPRPPLPHPHITIVTTRLVGVQAASSTLWDLTSQVKLVFKIVNEHV
jgi:hypothetical protein